MAFDVTDLTLVELDEETDKKYFKKDGSTPAIFEITFYFRDGIITDRESSFEMYGTGYTDVGEEFDTAVCEIATIADISKLLDHEPPELSNAVYIVGTLDFSNESEGDYENGYYDVLVVDLNVLGFTYFEDMDDPEDERYELEDFE